MVVELFDVRVNVVIAWVTPVATAVAPEIAVLQDMSLYNVTFTASEAVTETAGVRVVPGDVGETDT